MRTPVSSSSVCSGRPQRCRARRGPDTPGAAGRARHPGPRLSGATRRAVHRRLDGQATRRPPGASPARQRRGGTGEGGTAGVEAAAHRGDPSLGPLRLVERLVAALGGGHDLAAQLPAQLLDLVQQLVGRAESPSPSGRSAMERPISTTARMASTAANRSGPLPSATSRISAATGASATPAQKSMVSSGGRRRASEVAGAGMDVQPTHDIHRRERRSPGRADAPARSGRGRPQHVRRGLSWWRSAPSEEKHQADADRAGRSAPVLVCGPPASSEENLPT